MSYQQLVEQHNKITYRDNIIMVAQQLQNPIRAAVTIVTGTGETMNVAQLLGKKDARRAADRDRKNPDNPTKRTARWLVRPEAIEDGEYIDTATKWDAAMDPTSSLVRASVLAVERGIYDCILGIEKRGDGSFAIGTTGILGSTREGKRGETVVALPGNQTIAHGGTGLTLGKLREMKMRMNRADFGLEIETTIYGLITPKQVDDLIGIAAAAGNNLNLFDVEQLRTGKPSSLLGVTWIVTNRVPTTAAGIRQCAFWTKDNVVAAFWQELEGDVWNDPSAKQLPYIYNSAAVDATRYEDGGVFIIECQE